MATFGVYNMKEYIKGSHVNSIIFTFKNEQNIPIDLTGISAKMQIRKSYPTGKMVKEFTLGNGLTLNDAVNGVLQIDSFIIDFDVNKYHYDIKFEFPTGKIKIYVKGELNVIQNVTQDNC